MESRSDCDYNLSSAFIFLIHLFPRIRATSVLQKCDVECAAPVMSKIALNIGMTITFRAQPAILGYEVIGYITLRLSLPTLNTIPRYFCR